MKKILSGEFFLFCRGWSLIIIEESKKAYSLSCYIICVCLRIVLSNTYCVVVFLCVFLFVCWFLFVFVLCTLCCQFLCVCLRLMHLMLSVSLCLSSSYAPYVVSFSGLSILIAFSVFSNVYFLHVVDIFSPKNKRLNPTIPFFN
jgi:hypothetical protein